MLSIRLPQNLIGRLSALVDKTGKSKTYHVKEALEGYLEMLEDATIALERLESPTKRLTLTEAENLLG